MKNTAFEGFPTHYNLQPYEPVEKSTSAIKAFDIGKNFIIIQYKDNRIYLYNQLMPGKEIIDQMKERALNGDKLGTFINQFVRDNYIAYWDKKEGKFKTNKKFN